MKTTTYYAGGFVSTAPAQNRAEEQDSAAGTFTRWDQAGQQVERRPLTADETAALVALDAVSTQGANAATLRDQAAQALSANRTYVAVASPTAAQTTAQVKALSRQMNALIRLALGQLDGTD